MFLYGYGCNLSVLGCACNGPWYKNGKQIFPERRRARMQEQVWKHLFAAKFIALAGRGNDLLAEAYVHADQAWKEEGEEGDPESLADATYYELGANQ